MNIIFVVFLLSAAAVIDMLMAYLIYAAITDYRAGLLPKRLHVIALTSFFAFVMIFITSGIGITLYITL